MTLIEVVAAMALLSTLLVALLLAKARFVHQWTLADQRLRACAAADALLTRWWKDPGRFPSAAGGDVPHEPQMAWQTVPVHSAQAKTLGARIIRLEIRRRSAASENQVLASVEVLIPNEPTTQPK